MTGFRQDLTGQHFSRLLVVKATNLRKNRSVVWECLCDCGSIKSTAAAYLKTGHVKSCGCLNIESAIRTGTTHGMHNTPTWRAWKDMKARCYNQKLPNFEHYGARGITVCQRWMESFENFFEDMGIAPEGMSLGRIDNNGNYEKANCEWQTLVQQANNTRRNRFVEIDGRTQSVSQWAHERGVSRSSIRYRLNAEYSPKDAVMGIVQRNPAVKSA